MSENLKTKKIKRIEKPWGHELLWAHTSHYVAKVLFVQAGHSLSLQFHQEKEETMFIESGECVIESGPDRDHLSSQVYHPGDVFHVHPKQLHRLHAKTDCRIFEVSTPHLDDVVRLEDNYGRKS